MKFLAPILFVQIFGSVIPVAGFTHDRPAEQVTHLKLDSTELEVKVLLRNLEIPWDMSWAPDGWIWFSEKRGVVSRFSPDSSFF